MNIGHVVMCRCHKYLFHLAGPSAAGAPGRQHDAGHRQVRLQPGSIQFGHCRSGCLLEACQVVTAGRHWSWWVPQVHKSHLFGGIM